MKTPIQTLMIVLVAAAGSGLSLHANAFTLVKDPAQYPGWNSRQITFHVNTTGCTIPAADFNSAVDAALKLWSTVNTSDLVLTRGSDSTSTFAQVFTVHAAAQDPEIICDTTFQADVGVDQNFVTGVGGPAGFNAGDNRYNYGYVIMNASGGKADIATLSTAYLQVAIAHEVGHVLGLGHSNDPTAIMSYSHNATEARLGQDDVDGITYLYPRIEGGGDKFLGCGTLAVVGAGGTGRGGPRNGDGTGGSGSATAAAELLALFALCAAATRALKSGISLPRLT